MSTSTAQIPAISGLRANLVSHHQWAVSRWFYANPIWYYHRRSAAHDLCTGGRFYQLVDPMLREVCQLLNDAGLRTTPSCQGHSYPHERFEKIWSELKREEPAIRTTGLVVRDCENECEYLFRDDGYRLPWESEDQFYQQAGAHQELGYLGVVASDATSPLAKRLQQELIERPLENVRAAGEWSEALGGLLLEVHVNAAVRESRAMVWNEFTQRVRRLLECEHNSATPSAPTEATLPAIER